jgi:hypothetical protein
MKVRSKVKNLNRKKIKLNTTIISIVFMLIFSTIVIFSTNNVTATGGTIVINEVMFVTNAGDYDYMELYNTAGTTQSVKNWIIFYIQGSNPYMDSLPDSSWLDNMGSGYYLVIHFESGTDSGSWTNGIGHVYLPNVIDLGNTGTNDLAISDGSSTIDEVKWYPGQLSGYLDTSSISTGNTIGRDKASYDSDSMANGVNWEITCGWDVAYPTPGDINLNNILINEVFYTATPANYEWIELYNNGNIDINIDNWELTDEDGNSYSIPSATPDFPPGKYILISYTSGTNDYDFDDANGIVQLFYGTANQWSSATTIASLNNAMGLFIIDIDSDGDDDVFASSYQNTGAIYWYENDGTGSSWTSHTVATNVPYVNELYVWDIDGSNTYDCVVAYDYTGSSSSIIYYSGPSAANLKTAANWGTPTTIASLSNGKVEEIRIRNMDTDNDFDVVAVDSNPLNNQLVWHENKGTSWTPHTISANDGDYGLDLAIIDGDSDMDVVTTAYNNGNYDVKWWSNSQWGSTTIYNGAGMYYHANSVHTGDIDTDGIDNDVAVLWDTDKLTWHENSNSGASWTKHDIDDAVTGNSVLNELDVGDIEGNCIKDIVVCNGYSGSSTINQVIWYEPVTSALNYWCKHVIDKSNNIACCENIQYANINTDDDSIKDIVVTAKGSNKVVWYKAIRPSGIYANQDQCSLYVSSTHNKDTIEDFVAWGADPGSDDDNAYTSNNKEWKTSNAFKNTDNLQCGYTIGRDAVSSDSNQASDWGIISGTTPGSQNP